MQIHVCFATNDRYAPHAAALVVSIMRNKCSSEEIAFYFLSDKTSSHVQDTFRKMSQQWGFTLHIIEVSDELFKDFPLFNKSRAPYFRILMDRMLPQSLDKVLYLDCDTIVATSLSPLWETDISGKYAAVVAEAISVSHMPVDGPYFNSGMMLLNLKKYREENMAEKVIQWGKTYPERIRFPDQDMFNSAFQGNVVYLPYKWNVFGTYLLDVHVQNEFVSVPNFLQELQEAEKDPGIIHFLSKPWVHDCEHVCRRLYWKQAKQTPFYNRIVFEYYKSYFFPLITDILKLPERLLRRWIVKPLKAWFAKKTNADKNTNTVEIISLPSQESEESFNRHVA